MLENREHTVQIALDICLPCLGSAFLSVLLEPHRYEPKIIPHTDGRQIYFRWPSDIVYWHLNIRPFEITRAPLLSHTSARTPWIFLFLVFFPANLYSSKTRTLGEVKSPILMNSIPPHWWTQSPIVRGWCRIRNANRSSGGSSVWVSFQLL